MGLFLFVGGDGGRGISRGDMNLQGTFISLIYALVLLWCAFFAGFDTFAFTFWIADGGGHVSLVVGTLILSAWIGGLGLIIAAIGSWTRWPGIGIIALISVLMVFPSAAVYGWLSVRTLSVNTQHGIHYGFWPWASGTLPPILGIVAAELSWMRFRKLPQSHRS